MMRLSRRSMLKASGTAIALASFGHMARSAADLIVIHEGDAESREWLAALRQDTPGMIEARQAALLERGALASTVEWLAHFPQRRLLALVGDGEAVVLEGLLRQARASTIAVVRRGQRVLIDARL